MTGPTCKTLGSQWSEYAVGALDRMTDRQRAAHQITFYAGAFYALDCLADSVDGPEAEIFARLSARLKDLAAEIDARLWKRLENGA